MANDRKVNPTTITRTIKQLERELGFQLFHRTTRKIQPTEAGSVYHAHIAELLDELKNAKQLATDSVAHPRGRIRLSAPVSYAQAQVIPLMADFSRRYPEVTFDLILSDTFYDLINERIDIAIRIGSQPTGPYVVHKLQDMDTRIVATPDYIERYGKPESPADLTMHRCIVLSLPGFYHNRWYFESKSAASEYYHVEDCVRTSNAMAMKQCALDGMGIAMLATWMIKEELKRGQLIDCFPKHTVTAAHEPASSWVLYQEMNYLPNKCKVFLDHLLGSFQ